VPRVEGRADAGLSDRADGELAVLPQRDVHRPVVSGRLGELPGAVEGVDDPDPRGVQPVPVDDACLALLGHHRVVGPVRRAQRHQQVVGGQVAGVLELPAGKPLAADLGEQVARDSGGPGREGVVVGLRGDGRGGQVYGLGHAAEPTG